MIESAYILARAARRICLAAALMLSATSSLAAETTREPENMEVEERLGEYVPTDIELIDESGTNLVLRDLFETNSQKPIIIVPSYYTCPRLCTYIFNAVQKAASEVQSSRGLQPGDDYLIVSVSFRPEDTPAIASEKAAKYRNLFQPPLKPEAWRFLTGKPEQVGRLMEALGYPYRPDGEEDYTHGAAIMMLAPDGKITRYLYGVNFNPGVFRLSLVESSYGKIGNTVERVFLMCFRYDKQEGKYAPAVWVFVRTGGVVTMVFILGLIFLLRRKEKA